MEAQAFFDKRCSFRLKIMYISIQDSAGRFIEANRGEPAVTSKARTCPLAHLYFGGGQRYLMAHQ
jgi:hypothetical protein